MYYQEFSRRVKEKYPQYNGIDDRELATKIVDKYPQYQVEFDNIQPEQPSMAQNAQQTGFVPKGTGFNLLNPVRDVVNAGESIVQNAPQILQEFGKSIYDNASFEGLKSTVPAIARGVVTGAVDLAPMVAGLGVDVINSIADKEVIHMPRERRQPMATAFENWRTQQEMANNLSNPAYAGQDVSQYKPTNAVAEYISGNDGGAESARFAEGLGTFLVPAGAINKGVSGIRAIQAPAKVAKESARIASKLNDAQKLKYAKYIDKLAEKNIVNKMNSPIKKFADDMTLGAGLDALEGEGLEERFQNMAGGALMGGTMHIGMKGAGKAYSKAKPKVDNAIKSASEIPAVSTGIAYIDNMLNTNLSKNSTELTRLKKQYIDKITKDDSLARNLTKEQQQLLQDAQDLTPEQQKELFSLNKKGIVKHAYDKVDEQVRNVDDKTSPKDVANVFANLIEATNDKYARKRPVGDISNQSDVNAPSLEGSVVKTAENDLSVDSNKVNNKPAKQDIQSAEHSQALQDLLDSDFLDEVIDPKMLKKKVSLRPEEVKEGRRYTGSEPIDNYKKTTLESGVAEGADYLRTSKSQGAEDIYSGIVNDKTINRVDQLSENSQKKLNALKNVVSAVEDPRTNKYILVDKNTGKIIPYYQIEALRKKFRKEFDAYERELRSQYDERTQKEGLKQEIKEEAEFDREPIEEQDFDYSGEEGVNNNYIKEGFSKDDSIGDLTETKTRGNDATFEDKVSESKYQKFLKEFNNSSNKNAVLNKYLASVEPEQRGKIVQRISEELLKETESKAPRKIGDDYDSYKSAQEKSAKDLKTLSETTKDMNLKENISTIEVNETGVRALKEGLLKLSRDVLGTTKYKSLFKHVRKLENSGNFDAVAKTLMGLSKDKAQTRYNGMYEYIAQRNMSDNAKKYAIKSLNEMVRGADGVKTKDYHSVLKSTAKRNAIDMLGSAIKNNDVKSIVKIFREHEHKIHKLPNLTQPELDIINEAYAKVANNVVGKIKNIEDLVKSEREKVVSKAEKGGYKPESELFTRARIVHQLKTEYNEMSNIIRNSYTDRNLVERTKFNKDGSIERTGDTINKDTSDIRQKALKDIEKQIEQIFSREQDADIINRFYDKDNAFNEQAMLDYMDKLEKGEIDLDAKLLKRYAGAKNAWVERAISAGKKYKKYIKPNNAEVKAYKKAIDLMKERELAVLKEAKGGAKFFKDSKDARQAHAIAKNYVNGETALGDAYDNVKPEQQGEFYNGLSRALDNKMGKSKNAVAKFIDTVKKFSLLKTQDGYRYGNVPDQFKPLLKKQGWADKVRATLDFKELYNILPISDESANMLGKIIHGLDDSNIYLADKFNESSNGVTAVNGAISLVNIEGRTPSEILRTSVHELVHRYLRQNQNNPETLKEFGLTKEDLDSNKKSSEKRHDWLKGEGKPFKEYLDGIGGMKNYDESKAPKAIRELADIYTEKCVKWAENKEETVCNNIAEKIVEEVSTDEYRARRNDNKIKQEDSGDSRTTDSREQDNAGPPDSQYSDGNGFDRTTRTGTSDSNGLAKKTAKEFVDEVDKDFLKKDYNSFKHVDDNIESVRKQLEGLSNKAEEFFSDITAFSKEQMQNRKFMQDDWGEGIYFQQGGEPLGKVKFGEEKNSKVGYTGQKKLEGVAQHGTSAQATARMIQRDVRISAVKNRLDFLDKHFSKEPEFFQEGIANEYVKVNRNLFANAMYWGKSKAWYETMLKGEDAIRKTFKDTDVANKWVEASKLCKEDGRTLYLPKSLFEMSITGERELPIDYLRTYGHTSAKNRIKAVSKIAGVALDYYNDRFKRMVLTSASFFTNNRYGNQIMIMANASSPVEYIRSIFDATKLKDTDIPTEILESTLADAVWNETGGNKGGFNPVQNIRDNLQGKRTTKRYFSENKNNVFDNFVRILDGTLIDTKGLSGLQKFSANVANTALALPNAVFKEISNTMMEINSKAERFERKQVFAQTLNKMQREKVTQTARKMASVKHLIEEVNSDSAFRQTVIDKVADVLGDYNNYNKFEKNFMKKIIPFYAWNRTILRHSIALCKDNPTKLALIALKTLELLNQDDGLEEWQHGALKTNIYDKKARKNLVINKTKMIPYATLFDMYLNATGKSPEGRIAQVTPAIKKVWEAVLGEKTFKASSEIQNKRYKRMKDNGKQGYLDTKTGKFKEGGLPVSTRLAYLGKGALETVYPNVGSPLTKGLSWDVIKHKNETGEWRLPDRQYDASLGGYYDGDYIGKYKGKTKRRNARSKMELKHQLTNRLTGIGLQPEQRVSKSKEEIKEKKKRLNNKYNNR